MNREKTAIERAETNLYKNQGFGTLPTTSKLSHTLAKSYLRTFLPFLDVSSIKPQSHVYKTLLAHDNRLTAAHSILGAIQKSAKYYFKDELNNTFMNSFHSSSCKQYLIVNNEKKTEMIKAKGIKRNLQRKCVSKDDFVRSTHQTAKSINQYSLKRLKGAIYLVKQKKRVLSCFTTKRLFFKKAFQNDRAFGFPIHLKSYL